LLRFGSRSTTRPSTRAVKEICRERFVAFGNAGDAAPITPVSLDRKTAPYAKGAQDPVLH
jgi:fructose-bisphosphate aldolase class II